MQTLRSRRAFLSATWLGFTCLLALAGCGGNSQIVPGPPVATEGVQGQVTRGPISPVSQQGQTNEAPFPGVVITILTQKGAEMARQTTDSQGNFRITLSPGVYQVQGLAPSGSLGLPAPPAPQTVTVAAGQYVTVNLSYDTGIR